MKRFMAIILTLAIVMSLCVVPASAAGSGVTITITPDKSTVDTATGDAVVTYTVKAKVTDPSLKVGALTITLDPSAGLTLAEKMKKDDSAFFYQTTSKQYKYDEEAGTGIFETAFSYAPKAKTFVASGTTNARNLNSTHGEIVLMTIMGKIAKGTTGSVTLGASTANYGDPSGEASSIVNCEVTPATVTITKAPISSVTASVETPAAGQSLDFTGTVDAGAPYSITKVEWFEGTNATGTPVTGPATAKAKQYYYARITLTANPGETFAESLRNGDATPNGYSITRDGDGKLLLTKVYETQSFPAATVTAAPTAKSGLKYDGSDQALLGFKGTATGGTMQYSLDNSSWSTDIPMGKDAKTYTVYYMVKGDSGHSDYTPSDNTVSVKIDPKDISTAEIGTIASQSYTGGAITPDLVVTDGTATLTKDTDYTVSCSKNTYVGTADLTITGTGNYTGTKNANFTIVAADQNPTFTTPAKLATRGARLDLRTLVNGAKSDNMTFTISGGGGTSTYAVLDSDGYTLTSTVYPGTVNINVRIAAKNEGGDSAPEYNAFSKDNAITVNVVNKTSDTTTMKVSQGDITYGETIAPSVTDKPEDTGSVTFTYEGRDGTSYSSNATAPTNVGKYKVKATCESSTTIYTAEDDFEILPKSISGMAVTLDNTSLEYNGSAQTVNVTSVGSLTAADYTVTDGTSGTNVGSYTVTVTGNGNYKDTAQATWQITPAPLTVTPNASQSKKFNEVDPPALTYTYSGNASGQTAAFTGALNRAAGEDVGDYAIQIGTLALQDNGTFKAANYKLEFAATTVNFEIQKATFTDTAAKTVDILKNQTTVQSGTLTAKDFFTGAAPADAKITAVAPLASETMMDSVSVNTGTLSYTSNANIEATSNEAYTVTITTKNYNDITATLTFRPTNKSNVNVSITGVPTVQKPEITIIGSGKADLSADGRTATITAAAGHELVSVALNGKEMGKVEKLTGLKTGDKATITFQAKTDGKTEMDKMIAQKASKLTLMARSKKTAKLNIKVVVKGDLKAITDAGYTVKYKFYRSTKKSAGYKAMLTKKAPTYFNTYGKKGTMYYYKARVMIYDKEGNFVAQTALKQCKYANRLWTK